MSEWNPGPNEQKAVKRGWGRQGKTLTLVEFSLLVVKG